MKHLLVFSFLCSALSHFAFAQNCSDIDNHIVVNGDKIFFVKNCILHPIEDTQFYNELMAKTNHAPIEISNIQYSKLSIGVPYTPLYESNENLCATFNQKIVSSDNLSFYYIEKCQKRNFLNYTDVQLFTNTQASSAIWSISELELKQIPPGKPMSIPKSIWSEKTNLQMLQNLPSIKTVCDQLKTKAKTPYVSSYGSVFYLQNCTLHKVTNLTIELMQKADDGGGIYELSPQEILALPEGTPWNTPN